MPGDYTASCQQGLSCSGDGCGQLLAGARNAADLLLGAGLRRRRLRRLLTASGGCRALRHFATCRRARPLGGLCCTLQLQQRVGLLAHAPLLVCQLQICGSLLQPRAPRRLIL